jgi:hypothetical protein
VNLYLQGAVLGAILHQRGVFPLHAGGVAIGDQAVALAGPSGVGKSTLVTELLRRGATFIADDACVLTERPGDTFAVWPGAPRVKLDAGAISRLGGSPDGLAPAGGTAGKLHLPVDRPSDGSEPVPLRRVYLLQDDAGAVRAEPVHGLDAVAALIEETYFLAYAVALGVGPRCFRRAGAVASAAEVRRLLRPRGMQHVAAAAELIMTEAG